MRERTIENYFRDRVRELGGVALKLNTKSGRGWPDRLVLLPIARIGFAEIKSPTGRPTKLQQLRINFLKRLGFKADFIYSKNQADDFIESL